MYKGITVLSLLLSFCHRVNMQGSTGTENRLRFILPEVFVERRANEVFPISWERIGDRGKSPNAFDIHVQCGDAPPTVLLAVSNSSQTEARITVPYTGRCRLLASDDNGDRAQEGISEDFEVVGTSKEPEEGRGRVRFQLPVGSPIVTKVEFQVGWEHLGISRAPDTFDIRVKCASGEEKDDFVESTRVGRTETGLTISRAGKGCRLYAYSQDQDKGLEGRSNEFDVFASAEEASSSESGGTTVSTPSSTMAVDITSRSTNIGPTPTSESSSTAASTTGGSPATSGTPPPNTGIKLAVNGYSVLCFMLAFFSIF